MSHHLGERLSALIDGELGGVERDRVLAHLAQCEMCRREAVALRMVKQRMRALGDATADDTLTRRLIELAGGTQQPGGQAPASGDSRQRRAGGGPGGRPRVRGRTLAVAAVAVVGLGLPAAAFLAGGNQQHPPGPRVTPAVDVFMVQHAITTGDVPVSPPSSAVPLSPGVTPAAP